MKKKRIAKKVNEKIKSIENVEIVRVKQGFCLTLFLYFNQYLIGF